jgi:putative peptidoglycan lipid II flippase
VGAQLRPVGDGAAAESGTTRPDRRRNVLLHGAVITGVAFGVSTVLGLVRDLLLAAFFGVNGSTDAFLVAWTLPENAVPLLIDNAMALLMVPVFTRMLRERAAAGTGPGDPRDPVGQLVAATLPWLAGILVALSLLVVVGAPWLVAGLFPGLADPPLAVSAVRTIAASLVFIGIAGYFAAALRAQLVYGPPALINIAMNVGIIGLVLLAHREWGVLAAVLGATVGAALMLLVQLPAFRRHIGLPKRPRLSADLRLGAFLPIVSFIAIGQSQVFVERSVAAHLVAGTITRLNYVQKIGQEFTAAALILAVVTYPRVSRAIADGDLTAARRRSAQDVQIIGALVLAATAYLMAFAPEVVALLFQRGAFTASDTAATAPLLRIYVWGLLSQAVLALVSRSVFSDRATYRPALIIFLGVLTTALVANLGAPIWGGSAIAAANVIGMTQSAVLMVCVCSGVTMPARTVGLVLVRQVPATAAAGLFAWWAEPRMRGWPTAVAVIVGGIAVLAVYAGVAAVSGGLSGLGRSGPSPRSEFGRRRAGRGPWVLMYHSVTGQGADPYNIRVGPDRFTRQMRWLTARGLRGMGVTAALEARARGERDVVALTFDDGYADFATEAVPILRRFGFTATVYVLADRLGGDNGWDTEGPRKALMTPEQVRQVAEAGMEIGSHGLRHVSLPEQDPTRLHRELHESRAVLAELTGRPIQGLAYPYGHYGDRETGAARDAGYEHACGVGLGAPASVFTLSRTHVGQRDTAPRLWARKLQHDWLQR